MAVDLQVISAWGATAIVSLLTAREARVLEVGHLGDEAELLDVRVHQCPVFDQHAPGEEFEESWAVAGPDVRRRLRHGDRVLIHCRAGRGRSGMVAARLLVELGTQADDAIRLIRAARPGALLNPRQVEHVLSIRRAADAVFS